jgi:hypothetical protein
VALRRTHDSIRLRSSDGTTGQPRKMASRAAAPVAVLVGLLALPGAAQAVTAAKFGTTASVTAAITPKHLPKRGGAPVRLTIRGDASTTDLGGYALRSVDLALDRQLSVDTSGLPTCSADAIDEFGVTPSQARATCGAALIGTGTASETFEVPAAFPPSFDVTYSILFFNATEGGKPAVLMFAYNGRPVSSEITSFATGSVGIGQNLRFEPAGDDFASKVSFRFTLGRTWTRRGRWHSYLNGRCSAGALKQRITLTFGIGSKATGLSRQRCYARGGRSE